jgi:tRNA modification GTPase
VRRTAAVRAVVEREFPLSLLDTIAAIATPIGEGGLAVIRISGNQATQVADQVFRPGGKSSCSPTTARTHTIQYGHVVCDQQVIDEVLVSVMRAPRTFTREDVVEITCHGGLLASKAVLDSVLSAGARLAEPGEFTKRAFLSGRLDLAQAEAVADLIHARTDLALSAANEQLAGKLSQKINELRDGLVATLAHVEAHIDFPDEDISPDTLDKLLKRMSDAVKFIERLLRTANEGQILRRGVRAAIIGRPNAGKSSLLNHLLGHERAIVSPIPGTTRDTIEETANIRGLPVVFIDTAGLREAGDDLEAEGIRRSHASLQKAELILHVFDASEPLHPNDASQLDEFPQKKRIVVLNKADLASAVELPAEAKADAVVISCQTGQGIEELKDAIKARLWSGAITGESLQVMINSRHQDALRRGREGLERTMAALRAGEPIDLAASDLRLAVNAIGEVVGKTTTEDILDSIFSQFCLGK